MARYGEVATLAARTSRRGVNPVQAWNDAAARVYGDQPASRDKNCPKSAFLGLAEEGLISGVPAGNYARSRDNKRYAVEGVRLLQSEPALSADPGEMWRRVMAGEQKQHNEQMEVVAALWVAGDIAGAA